MAIFSYTYATLETAVKNWTEDDSTEFDAVLDDIMGLAELMIYRDVDLDYTKKHATVTGSASDQYLAKPTDFVADRSMYLTSSGVIYPLTAKSANWIRDYWETPASEERPKYYADWDDDTFLIAPTPDASYVYTLEYTHRPARLASDNTTTWLSTNAPDVLLFACLVQSAAFLQELNRGEEPGMLPVWEKAYLEGIKRLRDEEMRKQRRTEARFGESHGEI